MKRYMLLVLAVLLVPAPVRAGGKPEARKATIAFVEKLQMKDGGFLSAPMSGKASAPTLRATTAAVRALKYLGADVPNKEACKKFIADCFDESSGGFRDMPGQAKPDVTVTAVGLMAIAELGIAEAKYRERPVKYLTDNARTFDEIRIAVAGLESIKAKSPRNADWIAEVKKVQLPREIKGEPGEARLAATLAVTLLRLGTPLEDRAHYVKALKVGQARSGGFTKEKTNTADLETTYRVIRAFVMLKERPQDVEGVRSFVAKCRNSDGGYGVAPGEPSTVGATYYAAIIQHWLPKD